MFNWLMGVAGDMGAKGDFPTLDTPVPYETTVTVSASGYGVTATTDLPAVRAAVGAIRTMTESENRQHGGR